MAGVILSSSNGHLRVRVCRPRVHLYLQCWLVSRSSGDSYTLAGAAAGTGSAIETVLQGVAEQDEAMEMPPWARSNPTTGSNRLPPQAHGLAHWRRCLSPDSTSRAPHRHSSGTDPRPTCDPRHVGCALFSPALCFAATISEPHHAQHYYRLSRLERHPHPSEQGPDLWNPREGDRPVPPRNPSHERPVPGRAPADLVRGPTMQ